MSSNVKIALIIVFTTIVWLGSGLVFKTTQADSEQPISVLTKVTTAEFIAEEFVPQLTLSSHTAPFREVELKAEVAGIVKAVPGQRGVLIQAGETVCALMEQERPQFLKQSQAKLKQAEIAYKGALQLNTAGYQSDLAIAQAKANLEAAKLEVTSSQLNMQRLTIKAPFTAVVEKRPVEVGDYLSPGQTCATLVELNPLKIIAQASEADVEKLKLGDQARASFDANKTKPASLTYISYQANASTRGYLVEASLDNADLHLRAGLSAQLHIDLSPIQAHLIPASLIILDAEGDIMVRAVDSQNRVLQQKLVVVGEADNGLWVKGLPSKVNLITVGQNYVSEGETVEIFPVYKP
ncbi:MAG: efflux RND transporter periplasmic adaptor subunit [Porticoccaceae bacterium]